MANTEDRDDLTAYYENIYRDIEQMTNNDPYGNYVFQRVTGGQKTVYNKTQTEIRNFDMSFLDTIESVYPAILKIMRDPKKSIRYEQEVVSVEKAKKVNSDTVRHLSSHTQLIKEITAGGDVIPSKVLTTYAEEELGIYENRFIKSLVKRMEMFLERRYEVMKVSLESYETQKFNVQNDFLLSGQKVTVNLDIQIKNDLTTNVQATKEQYNRLLYVRELVQGLKGTDFMRALAKARDVLPPIMKTNILMHNPDFKLAYGLWLYLDKVDGISTNIDVREKTYKYTDIFQRDINQCMTLALTSFIKNREVEGIYTSRTLPQIKAPKPTQNEEIELELNYNADNKKLEDYTMNQILLDETAKFFEASFSGIQRTGITYNESIRVVYRQMLDLLDQIYPRAFGQSDDQLESKDLYQQIDFQRKKLMITKIVHQQKQANILKMGKEEKRIEKQITALEGKIKVYEEKEREKEEKRLAREEAQRQAAIKKAAALEEKRKRLEQEAITKQKIAEKKALEQKKKDNAGYVDLKKAHQASRSLEATMRRRERLRELKTGISQEERINLEAELLEGIKDEEIFTAPVEPVVPEVPVYEEPVFEEAATDDIDAMLDALPEKNTETSDDSEIDALLDALPEKGAEASEEDDIDALLNALPEKGDTQSDEEDIDSLLDAIPEKSEDDDIDAMLDAIPEKPQSNEDIEAEFEAAINSIPDDAEEEVVEEIVYVDEDGNPVENYEESAEYQAADDYEQMLRDSGMTDEEIAAMLGIPDEPKKEAPKATLGTPKAPTAPVEEEVAEEEDEYVDSAEEEYEEVYEEEAQDEAVVQGDPDAFLGDGTTEDDEFDAFLNSIPEGKPDASNPEEDEFMAAINNIPDSVSEANNQAADDYEKMLKESGMTDEEIAALLGGDE